MYYKGRWYFTEMCEEELVGWYEVYEKFWPVPVKMQKITVPVQMETENK